MSESPGTVEALPESASLLLDVLRFGLALLVVAGHLTLPFFCTAWPPLLAWADAAVPAFFVLSGFMIRHVTLQREHDPRRYFISRVSRMYSVLLPAIALTLACNAVVQRLTPGYAAALFHDNGDAGTLVRIAAHLIFFTQFWGHAVLLPPNLPLWSLGYEAPSYVLFGLLTLCRGRWRWLAAAYGVLLGPQVLFLLPLWWSGCWLHDVWQWARTDGARHGLRHTAAVCTTALLLLAMLASVDGAALWSRLAQSPNPLWWLHQPQGRATMLAYASGAVAWLAMLLGLLLSDRIKLRRHAAWARPVRRVAEGTFVLYLFHYPLLCLIVPLLGRPLRTQAEAWTALLLIVLLCVIAAVPVERLKIWMRRQLTARLIPASR